MGVIIGIIWLHWLADFVFQTDSMALNKSKSYYWLTIHCATYAALFIGFGWQFALITFALHWLTDAITSRGTAWLWQKNERHWFFTLIGFDQAIHLTTLILTYKLLYN